MFEEILPLLSGVVGENLILFSGGLNLIQLIFFITIMGNKSVGSLIMAWLTKKTWLQYERVNGSITTMPVELSDGAYEDKAEGMFVVTPGSTKLLAGGIKTAVAYEGIASTIPTKFAVACKNTEDLGFENIQQIATMEQVAKHEPKNEGEKSFVEEAKKIIKTIDFSVIRNFFLYDFTPRGMRAMVNRKVSIELQDERNKGLAELLTRPDFLMAAAILLVIIGTVVYPAITSQEAINTCQTELTKCLTSKAAGISVG